MRIFCYVRTSEVESGAPETDSEVALESILAEEWFAMQRYCSERFWKVEELVTDQAVAWNADFGIRPAGSALLSRLESGDGILVYSMERMFSSCCDASATLQFLKAAGISLHVVELGGDVTDSSLQLTLVTAARLFAGLERRRSIERIKNVKKNQRNKGRYLGGTRPFGYMIHSNGRLIANPMEQKVLKKIVQLRDQGKSLRVIASEVSTPVAPVSFKTVQRILQRNV